ncbi:MAG: pyruvate, phosphate dikinase, partial [Candidatus Lokiarchaeota archaeon]|nr:pyruvate, phosphate dikinase [Candidatus Lokiarchaeota archaeon]
MTSTENKKFVYDFSEGNKDQKNLLGGKGANLAEMTNLGLNIPPGFTITTEACLLYFGNPEKIMKELKPIVIDYLKALEENTGKKFGDNKNPLLVSVRSGAPMSMPGMMDTVLNLGLNDQSVLGLGEQTENPRFAYDSYRRFIQMAGDVIMGIGDEKFERILNKYKRAIGRNAQDTDLGV